MSRSTVTIVKIEGLAATNGSQAALCFPRVPAYGGAEYVQALAAHPRGRGARWNPATGRVTAGEFELRCHDAVDFYVLTWDWYRSRPVPITEVSEDIDASETIWDCLVDPLAVGIASGSELYIGTETITAGGGSTTQITGITRGVAGSTAVAHPAGSDVYDHPPAFIGRVVEVYTVDENGAAPTTEVLRRRGFIQSDPAGRNGIVTFSCGESSVEAKLNPKPAPRYASYSVLRESGQVLWRNVLETEGGGLVAEPRFHASGGYFGETKSGLAIVGAYTGGQWIFELTPAWGDITKLPKGGTEAGPLMLYEFAYSLGDYSPYTSAHPCDIFRNHLASTEAGTNGTYDVGTLLAPEHALGVPDAQIDHTSFDEAKAAALAGVTAKFWYGGPRRESVEDLAMRLFGALGFAVAVTPAGVFVLVTLADVYPGSLTPLTTTELRNPAAWAQTPVSRPVDTIALEVDAGPFGREGVPIPGYEKDAAALYPEGRGVKVGGTQDLTDAPYTSDLFLAENSPGERLLARRVRRLADGITVLDVEASLGAVQDLGLQIGGSVTILAAGLLRDPVTGAIQAEAGDEIRCKVTQYDPDEGQGVARLGLVATATSSKVATISPGATVVSYDHTTKTVTVAADDWSETGDDATTFAAAQSVHLVSVRGVVLSTVAEATIASVGAAAIVLNAHWQDGSGDMDGQSGRNAPSAGDWVVLGSYDNAIAADLLVYAWGADVSPNATSVPSLGAGGAVAYVYGD